MAAGTLAMEVDMAMANMVLAKVTMATKAATVVIPSTVNTDYWFAF